MKPEKKTYRAVVTDYGMDATEETTYRQGVEVLWLMRRHRAWLQMLVGEAHEDLTPMETFDAFANLRDAKRDSMEYVEKSDDFERPFRWVFDERGKGWILTATYLDRLRYFEEDGVRSYLDQSDEEDE